MTEPNADAIRVIAHRLAKGAERFDSALMAESADDLFHLANMVASDERLLSKYVDDTREALSQPFPLDAWFEIGRLMDAGQKVTANDPNQ